MEGRPAKDVAKSLGISLGMVYQYKSRAVVHDNVVAIHAVDLWNGSPYPVMSYLAGRSLQERVDQDGPLEVREILRIGMQTAMGLVHRDVKPLKQINPEVPGWLAEIVG